MPRTSPPSRRTRSDMAIQTMPCPPLMPAPAPPSRTQSMNLPKKRDLTVQTLENLVSLEEAKRKSAEKINERNKKSKKSMKQSSKVVVTSTESETETSSGAFYNASVEVLRGRFETNKGQGTGWSSDSSTRM